MLNKFAKAFIPKSILQYLKDLRSMSVRIAELERRTQNRRHLAIDELADYLVSAQIPGDYFEFGVYKGWTFSYAYKVLSTLFKDMEFYAFDSFEGLPKPRGIDTVNGYSSNFHEHEFSCTKEEFIANLKCNNVDIEKLHIIKGWFEDTLNPEKAKIYNISKIAAVWIDVDLYESTIPVLNFITPYLSVGSIIIFDDWRCFRNLPDFGEQRACREWLNKNPQITLHELFSFGWFGIAFTVGSC